MARNRAWADSIFIGAQINDEATSLTNLLADVPTVDTLTAVRIVLEITIAHGVDETQDLSSAVSLGIGVCNAEAFAIGQSALSEPQDSTDYSPRGWLYVGTKPVLRSLQTEGISVRSAEFTADLRAMRKIDKGILFMSVQNNAILGATAVDIWGRVRVLCLT